MRNDRNNSEDATVIQFRAFVRYDGTRRQPPEHNARGASPVNDDKHHTAAGDADTPCRAALRHAMRVGETDTTTFGAMAYLAREPPV